MRFIRMMAVLVATTAACAGPQPSGDVETTQSPIVNGAPDDGHPSVVGIVSLFARNGYLYYLSCTGTYIAPRLVLTAAHCMPENRYTTRVFFGKDLKSALDTVPWWTRPVDGEPWAIAEAFKVNPAFTRDTYYADIAVVSLDRELPIPITPIGKWRLDDKQIGTVGTEVGFGAIAADKLLTTTTGSGLKRVGQAPFMGSPPATMETDHPGIGIQAVRDSLAMFDGHAPYSNVCAGDSGGPMLMSHGGTQYVFGVSSWTGYYCADYAFYTRIDPFVSFIEEAAQLAGRGPIKPVIECARPLGDGRTRVYYGYQSDNDVSLDVPGGDDNRMPADVAGFRPTHFMPGTRHYSMAADYAANENPFWKIKAPSGHASVVSDSAAATCATDDVAAVAADMCLAMSAARCGYPMDQCVADGLWQYDPSYCGSQWVDYMRCQGTLPAEGFMCDYGMSWDVSETCMDAANAYFGCLFGV